MYVLLGSNGNITSKVAARLLREGSAVRVVGRSKGSLAALESAGAQIAVGEIADERFLARAFAGAAALYAMMPTDYTTPDLSAAQDGLGESIARAIAASGVRRVVNLSSIGAHLSSGTGPIAGLYRQEQRLNALQGVDVLHVRPGYFYENHLGAIDLIAANGVYADMTAPDAALPMASSVDIAHVVARELRSASGQGKRVLHLHTRRLYSMRQSATILGAAIGAPQLRYVQADPQEMMAALRGQGVSDNVAMQLHEMSTAFSSGRLNGEFERGPSEITPMTLEEFAASTFRPAFKVAAKGKQSPASKLPA